MECRMCGEEFEYDAKVVSGNLCGKCLAKFQEHEEEEEEFHESLKAANKFKDPQVGELDDVAKRLLLFILAENKRAWDAAAPGRPKQPWKPLSWEKADKVKLRAMARPIYEGAQMAAQNRRLVDSLTVALKGKTWRDRWADLLAWLRR